MWQQVCAFEFYMTDFRCDFFFVLLLIELMMSYALLSFKVDFKRVLKVSRGGTVSRFEMA